MLGTHRGMSPADTGSHGPSCHLVAHNNVGVTKMNVINQKINIQNISPCVLQFKVFIGKLDSVE